MACRIRDESSLRNYVSDMRPDVHVIHVIHSAIGAFAALCESDSMTAS
jgi:hypothetical protein